MALTPPPAVAGGEEEGGIGEFILILKELEVRVTAEGPIILDRSTGKKIADMSWREWRIVKSFVDNIYSELRAAGMIGRR